MPASERVPLHDIKTIARRELDPMDPLRRLLLSQPASLPAGVFLARVGDWLRLIDMAERRPLRLTNTEDLDDELPADEGGA